MGYRTIQDWYAKQVRKGKIPSVNSRNPYIRKIMRAAGKYGLECPFKVAIGKVSEDEKRVIQAEYEKKVINEKRLLSTLIGGLLNEN